MGHTGARATVQRNTVPVSTKILYGIGPPGPLQRGVGDECVRDIEKENSPEEAHITKTENIHNR